MANKLCQRRAAKMTSPAFAEVVSPARILTFASVYNYPVVIKPQCIGGSKGVQVLRSDEDVFQYLKSGDEARMPWYASIPLLVECFVQYVGFFHVDGVVVAGVTRLMFPGKYSCTMGEMVFGNVNFISSLSVDKGGLFSEITQFSESVLRALEKGRALSYCFHLELFLRSDGRFVLCECNPRPPGGVHPDTMRCWCGLDIVEMHYQLQLGVIPRGLPSTWEEQHWPVQAIGDIYFLQPLNVEVFAVPTDFPKDFVTFFKSMKSSSPASLSAQMLVTDFWRV